MEPLQVLKIQCILLLGALNQQRVALKPGLARMRVVNEMFEIKKELKRLHKELKNAAKGP